MVVVVELPEPDVLYDEPEDAKHELFLTENAGIVKSYEAVTEYCGFSFIEAGKTMGLAPYGEPKYVNKIKDNLIDVKDDGTFRLDISYFKYHRGFRMTGRKFHSLFGKNRAKERLN